MNSALIGIGIIGVLMLVFIACIVANLDNSIKEMADYIDRINEANAHSKQHHKTSV